MGAVYREPRESPSRHLGHVLASGLEAAWGTPTWDAEFPPGGLERRVELGSGGEGGQASTFQVTRPPGRSSPQGAQRVSQGGSLGWPQAKAAGG